MGIESFNADVSFRPIPENQNDAEQNIGHENENVDGLEDDMFSDEEDVLINEDVFESGTALRNRICEELSVKDDSD